MTTPGAELEGLRFQLRDWIRNSVPAGLTGPGHAAWAEWERRLLEARLVCPQWPEDAGGRGWDRLQLRVLDEECRRARVERVTRGAGEWVVGPTLIVHGTPEQRQRILPSILAGRERPHLAFSEPDCGSDLAAVETRAGVAGDGFELSGVKAWVPVDATSVLALVRAGAARALTCVLLWLGAPGLQVAAVPTMDGSALLRLSLDRVQVPPEDVVGRPGAGWAVARTALAFARAGPALGQIERERDFWDVVEEARHRGLDRDPLVRQELASAYARVRALGAFQARQQARAWLQPDPGPAAALARLAEADHRRRLAELAAGLLGADGMLEAEGGGGWQQRLLGAPAETLAAGSVEILRDLVAERLLGLPREPSVREKVVDAAPG
jgi:alkylation response protein AidB-like acyl-CoA dehydrogenase